MEDCLARRASTLSCSSGTSSTYAGCGFVGDPSIWTSGTFGSSAGKFSSGAGAFGFDSFGSFPSFNALTIRTAFHFAYLIFDCVSASGGAQMLTSSRKVAAAWKVSAVCLWYVKSYASLEIQEPYFVTLSACTALSALWNVSSPNCSTNA